MSSYHIDFTSFVVNKKTMDTITNYDTKDQNKFLKTLVDEGLLEIVNVDVADDGYEVNDLHKYLKENDDANT